MDLRPHKEYLQMWMTSLGCKILYSLAQLLCLYTLCLHSKVFYSTEPSKLSIQRSLQLAKKFVTCHLLNLSPSGDTTKIRVNTLFLSWLSRLSQDWVVTQQPPDACIPWIHSLYTQSKKLTSISYTFLLTLYYTHSYVINPNKSVCTTSNHLGSSVQHGWKMI